MANKPISRRNFLKGMAAGAVSVATMGALGGSEIALASDADTSAASASGSLTYTPGTYSASAAGIASDVTVTMTFDETSITDVQIDVSGETADIGGAIGDQMAQAILDAQSCDVDAVSSATVTSNAIKTAAADCISQASGTTVTVSETEDSDSSDWLGEAPEISEDEITETLDTEVLVVGCGSGGWIAAMTAAEEGAKVLVVEKRESPTGPREDIGSINSKLQQESFEEYPEFEIDKMEALQDIVRYGSGYVNSDLIRCWEDNSGEMVDWLTELLEDTGNWYMSLEGGVGDTSDPGRDKAYATGHSPHTTDDAPEDTTLNSTFQAHCDDLGVEWKLSTALVKLEQDDSGKVTGIIAQDQNDSHYVRVNASKGVIMCTGGYATNTEMMKALQPQTLEMKVNFSGTGSTCDGSGIKAMLWAGAKFSPVHASMLFNRCCVKPDETAGYETTGQWFWFGEQPFLKVNLNGERFCNESGPYEFMLHSMWMQPYHTYCDIFDANNKEYAEQFDEVGCCRLFAFPNGALSNMTYDYIWSVNEGLIEDGYIQKADTLEELAEKLNIPADTFVTTVERYNEMCAAGEDTDYGKEKHRLTPVDTAPFYGVRTAGCHLTTLSGCLINTNMQVIQEDGTPIEGLYATGDCSGGFFGNTYPNLFTGLACGRTMTFARRAAQIVAAL